MDSKEALRILEDLGYEEYIDGIYIKQVNVKVGKRKFTNQISVTIDMVFSVPDFKQYDSVLVSKALIGISGLYDKG